MLGRIEEGLRTNTKVVLPRGYHPRADYIDVLLRKGWGRSQIERITGWNMWEGRHRPSAVITSASKLNVESVPAGTEIHAVAGDRSATITQAVVLAIGPLKIAVEGNPEAIEALAARMIESARVMRGDDTLLDLGA